MVGDPERKPTARRPKRRSVAGVDQEELVEPRELADADSFFCEFNGVEIHYKTCHHAEIAEEEEVREKDRRVSPKVAITFPIILLHGFGASAFSWDRVMKPLSRLVGSKVLAFDRPAFGLTARRTVRSGDDDDDSLARPLNPYSMTFSVLATLFFIDLLAAAGKKKEEEKAILIGSICLSVSVKLKMKSVFSIVKSPLFVIKRKSIRLAFAYSLNTSWST